MCSLKYVGETLLNGFVVTFKTDAGGFSVLYGALLDNGTVDVYVNILRFKEGEFFFVQEMFPVSIGLFEAIST